MRAGRARWSRERACTPCRPTPARSKFARSLPSSPRARAFCCARRAARTSITSSIRRTLLLSAESRLTRRVDHLVYQAGTAESSGAARQLAAVEKSFRHRVDDGRGVGGDDIDARLDLGQRAERLLEEMLRVILHCPLELVPRHH